MPGPSPCAHQASIRSAIAVGSLRHGVEIVGSSVAIIPPVWLW
jgi:hypothetical protein